VSNSEHPLVTAMMAQHRRSGHVVVVVHPSRLDEPPPRCMAWLARFADSVEIIPLDTFPVDRFGVAGDVDVWHWSW
jgi:hypothetical protein